MPSLRGMERYFDRVDAGRRLAEHLLPRLEGPAVVLAVPRGGVQVGAQVAKALRAPLLPLLVRKVGLPEQPEVVIGAIDADGAIVTDRKMADVGLFPAELEGIGEDVARRLLRWRRSFGSPDPAAALRGHVAVLVDDAIVSGLTAAAGVRYLERRGAGRIVVAVPSAVDETARRMEERGLEVVAPVRVERPEQIPQTYAHLPEVSAKEVAILLAQAGPSSPPHLALRGGTDEPLRLVDAAMVAHRSRLRVPRGIGPAPALVLVGLPEKDRHLVARLAEAGIASLRIDGAPEPAAAERALETALGVLAAHPEIDPHRMGVLGVGTMASIAVEVAERDARARVLVLLDPVGTPVPARAMVLRSEELCLQVAERLARWAGDRLQGSAQPTESA